MTVGIYTIELHLPAAHSLKDKRQVFRRLKDRLSSRYNVAVAEVPQQADLWQRGSLTLVSVARTRDALVQLFESIYRDTEQHLPGRIIEKHSDFIESTDAGPRSSFEDTL